MNLHRLLKAPLWTLQLPLQQPLIGQFLQQLHFSLQLKQLQQTVQIPLLRPLIVQFLQQQHSARRLLLFHAWLPLIGQFLQQQHSSLQLKQLQQTVQLLLLRPVIGQLYSSLPLKQLLLLPSLKIYLHSCQYLMG